MKPRYWMLVAAICPSVALAAEDGASSVGSFLGRLKDTYVLDPAPWSDVVEQLGLALDRAEKGEDPAVFCPAIVADFKAKGQRLPPDFLEQCHRKAEVGVRSLRARQVEADQAAQREVEINAKAAEAAAREQQLAQVGRDKLAAQLPGVIDAVLAGLISGSYGSPEAGCYDVLWDIRQNNNQAATTTCVSKVSSRYAEAIKAKDFRPQTCAQWAAHAGGAWSQAELGMKVSLVAVKAKPIRFEGKVTNGGDGSMVIQFSRYGEVQNAIVAFNDKTTLTKEEGLVVNGYVWGYGFQTGSQQVELVDGSVTRVPTIQASCLQG